MSEKEIGKVAHYFDKIDVAAISITDGDLLIGDTIHIKGSTSDVTAVVESMQMDHQSVKKVSKGDDVGVKVVEKVRGHDTVFKVFD